jgi:hypothetical protein
MLKEEKMEEIILAAIWRIPKAAGKMMTNLVFSI